MDDEKVTTEDSKKKPAPDIENDELPDTELEKVAGGAPDLDAGGNA